MLQSLDNKYPNRFKQQMLKQIQLLEPPKATYLCSTPLLIFYQILSMKTLKIFLFAILLLLCGSIAHATTYYQIAAGNWATASTWSTVGPGGAAAASAPTSADDVILYPLIGTVTASTAQTITNVTIQNAAAGDSYGSSSYTTLNVTAVLTITGTLTITHNLSSGSPLFLITASANIVVSNVSIGKNCANFSTSGAAEIQISNSFNNTSGAFIDLNKTGTYVNTLTFTSGTATFNTGTVAMGVRLSSIKFTYSAGTIAPTGRFLIDADFIDNTTGTGNVDFAANSTQVFFTNFGNGKLITASTNSASPTKFYYLSNFNGLVNKITTGFIMITNELHNGNFGGNLNYGSGTNTITFASGATITDNGAGNTTLFSTLRFTHSSGTVTVALRDLRINVALIDNTTGTGKVDFTTNSVPVIFNGTTLTANTSSTTPTTFYQLTIGSISLATTGFINITNAFTNGSAGAVTLTGTHTVNFTTGGATLNAGAAGTTFSTLSFSHTSGAITPTGAGGIKIATALIDNATGTGTVSFATNSIPVTLNSTSTTLTANTSSTTPTTFYQLTINKASLTTTGFMNITNAFTNGVGAALTLNGTNTVNFTGTPATMSVGASGTTFSSLKFSNTNVLAPNGPITITGTFTDGTGAASAVNFGTNAVTFTSTSTALAANATAGTTFNSLSIASTSVATTGTINVTNSFANTSGAALSLTGTHTVKFTTGGATLAAGTGTTFSTLSFTHSTGTITPTGTINISSTFTNGTTGSGVLNLTGGTTTVNFLTGSTTLTAKAAGTTFYNLAFNTSTSKLTVSGNINVSNSFTNAMPNSPGTNYLDLTTNTTTVTFLSGSTTLAAGTNTYFYNLTFNTSTSKLTASGNINVSNSFTNAMPNSTGTNYLDLTTNATKVTFIEGSTTLTAGTNTTFYDLNATMSTTGVNSSGNIFITHSATDNSIAGTAYLFLANVTMLSGSTMACNNANFNVGNVTFSSSTGAITVTGNGLYVNGGTFTDATTGTGSVTFNNGYVAMGIGSTALTARASGTTFKTLIFTTATTTTTVSGGPINITSSFSDNTSGTGKVDLTTNATTLNLINGSNQLNTNATTGTTFYNLNFTTNNSSVTATGGPVFIANTFTDGTSGVGKVKFTNNSIPVTFNNTSTTLTANTSSTTPTTFYQLTINKASLATTGFINITNAFTNGSGGALALNGVHTINFTTQPATFSVGAAGTTLSSLKFSTTTGTITPNGPITLTGGFTDGTGVASSVSFGTNLVTFANGCTVLAANATGGTTFNKISFTTNNSTVVGTGIINITGAGATFTDGTSSTGKVNFTSGTVNTTGTAAVSFVRSVATGNNTTFYNLTCGTTGGTTISNSAAGTAGFAIASAGVLTLNTGCNLAAGTKLLTLNSDATGTASVATIPPGTNVTGTVTAQRYITGAASGTNYRGYRLLSSPVYAATVSSVNVYDIKYLINSTFLTGSGGTGGGFDAGNGKNSPTVYLFREDQAPNTAATFSGGNWLGISKINNTNAYDYCLDGSGSTIFNIPVGNSFLVFFRGDRTTTVSPFSSGFAQPATLGASGTLNQGSIVVSDWYTPASTNLGYTSATANTAVRGFNMVGNPYACTIDWRTTTTGGINLTNVDNTVYTLNTNGTFSTYQWDGTTATTIGNGQRYIASGQGFFVRANDVNPALTFNESAKVIQQVTISGGTTPTTTLALRPMAINSRLRLKLVKDEVNYEETYFGFSPNASPKMVVNEDAGYLSGTSQVHLSSLSSDGLSLVINRQPLPSNRPTIIPCNVAVNASGNYQLACTELADIPDLYEVWLKDAFTKDSVDLRVNKSYSFTVNTGDATTFGDKRFTVLVRQKADLMVKLTSFNAKLVSATVPVKWNTEHEANYTGFELQRSTDYGKTYATINTIVSSSQGAYNYIDKKPVFGTNMYRLKMTDLNGTVTYSDAVSVVYNPSTVTLNSTIRIYPNPTTSSLSVDFTMLIKNTESVTTYQIKIYNNNGVNVLSKTQTATIWQTDVSSFKPGTYLIKIFGANNTLIGDAKFVKL